MNKKTKILNYILLMSNATSEQRMFAIGLLNKINPIECINTVNNSIMNRAAKNNDSDMINRILRSV